MYAHPVTPGNWANMSDSEGDGDMVVEEGGRYEGGAEVVGAVWANAALVLTTAGWGF